MKSKTTEPNAKLHAAEAAVGGTSRGVGFLDTLGRTAPEIACNQVEQAGNEKRWKDLQLWATKALRLLPRDQQDRHWVLAERAFAYLKQGKIAKALTDSRKARLIDPFCPKAMMTHAIILVEFGWRESDRPSLEEAVLCCEKFISYGVNGLRSTHCGPMSPKNVRQNLNDMIYTLAFAHWNLGNKLKAKRLLARHIKGREAGLDSIYNLRETRQKLLNWK